MKIHQSKRRSRVSLLIFTVYFILISGVVIHSIRKPEYNWDMLPYMAVVLSGRNTDIGKIKQDTYRAARENIPAAFYQQLINPSNPYRKKMYLNDTAFYQQLPFYVVKPLYTSMVFLSYRAGFSLPAATVLPSALAYLFISVLLLYWLNKYLPPLHASGAALLIMLSAPLLAVARLSTPDAVSAFLMLGAFYFIVQKPRPLIMVLFMAAAVFARPDNIMPCVLILLLLAITKESPVKISVKGYIGIFLLLCCCYFFDSFRARPFGFDFLFYPSFLHSMNVSREDHGVFSLKEYLEVFRSDAITGLYNSSIALFGFLALLLLYKDRIPGPGVLSFYSLLPLLLCLIILIRFILVPDISDRFYIPYYLIVSVLLVKKIASDREITNEQNQEDRSWKFQR